MNDNLWNRVSAFKLWIAALTARLTRSVGPAHAFEREFGDGGLPRQLRDADDVMRKVTAINEHQEATGLERLRIDIIAAERKQGGHKVPARRKRIPTRRRTFIDVLMRLHPVTAFRIVTTIALAVLLFAIGALTLVAWAAGADLGVALVTIAVFFSIGFVGTAVVVVARLTLPLPQMWRSFKSRLVEASDGFPVRATSAAGDHAEGRPRRMR